MEIPTISKGVKCPLFCFTLLIWKIYMFIFIFPVVVLKILIHISKYVLLICRINKCISLRAWELNLFLTSFCLPYLYPPLQQFFYLYLCSLYSPGWQRMSWAGDRREQMTMQIISKEAISKIKKTLLSHHLINPRCISQCVSPEKQNQ